MGKKNEGDRLADLVEELLENVEDDRSRLSDFLDRLIETGESPVLIAEYVAKIAAELTRQNHVKVATVKALGKNIVSNGSDEEDDDIANAIGRPFEDEIEEGSN